MNSRIPPLLVVAVLAATAFLPAVAAPVVGQAAPDFTLTDLQGRTHTLSALRGKTVVLEWTNPECPVVGKHYDRSGNLPKLQQDATGDGVVWLAINSGHAGAQGDLDDAAVAAWRARNQAAFTAYLRDRDGTVGRRYDARTTPHLFVINPAGTLVYAGGIDDLPSGNPADIAKATNLVRAALEDVKAGRPVRQPTSQPYGCAVKYGE